jgi:ubiquinone/menaquinone biosynthesis C-methylase UbiE
MTHPDIAARQEQIAFHRRADGARFDTRLSNPFVRRKEMKLARLVAQHVPPRGARVLEVGCGEGANLWHLRRERPDGWMVGIDLSPAKVGFMRQTLPGVEGVAADALHLPFRDGEFDAVLLRDLLHHVNWNRDGVVAESLRVLRTPGTLIVLEGDGRTMMNRLFGMLYPVERGMKDSTGATIRSLLSRYGQTSLHFVEPSSAVRAAGFLLGWPTGVGRIPAFALCFAASCWEAVAARLWRRSRWVYMLATVRRS